MLIFLHPIDTEDIGLSLRTPWSRFQKTVESKSFPHFFTEFDERLSEAHGEKRRKFEYFVSVLESFV